MSHHVAALRFTLGSGQSIGPTKLRELWIIASQSPDIAVERNDRGYNQERPIYTLFAPSSVGEVGKIEQRLRELLDDMGLRASFVPIAR